VRGASCSSFLRDSLLLLCTTAHLRSVTMFCNLFCQPHLTKQQKNYRTRNHSLFVGTCLSLFNSILESAEQQIHIKANEDDASFQAATREDLPKLGASMALRVGEVFARITGTGEAAMQPGDISAVSASDLSRYLATRMNNQLLFGDELGMYQQLHLVELGSSVADYTS
jgi:hypothetical protein